MNNKIIIDYIWLDGYETQNIRSKIKVLDWDTNQGIKGVEFNLEDVPVWSFDGSSTKQAEGSRSECLLKPVRLYKCYYNQFIVLCEVLNTDDTPHDSNTRSSLRKILDNHKKSEFWWGFEQEYFMMEKGKPSGWPDIGFPKPQGEFYCAAGSSNVVHRDIAIKHMYECLNIGIDITGVNAEVALGQWEFQCFNKDTLKACDDLWVSRYLLQKITEKFEVDIDFSPKPVKGDWNGSGCHTNFSNKTMRSKGSKNYFIRYLANLEANHDFFVSHYGEQNDERLTGLHETQHIDIFSSGVADRGASIRIPYQVPKNGWCGYLEDRRPASNCDPYKVAKLIVDIEPESAY